MQFPVSRFRSVAFLFPAFALLAAPAPAGADDLPRTHDGLFLRLASGPAFLWAKGGNGKRSTEGPGGGLGFHAMLGGCVVRDLALAAEFEAIVGMADPLLIQAFVGITAQYYVSPANVYVGGGIGVAPMGASFGAGTADSVFRSTGLGLHVDVGKEWWVSDRWGVGLGTRVSWAHGLAGDRADMVGVSLLVAATFN